MPLNDFEKEELPLLRDEVIVPDFYSPAETIALMDCTSAFDESARLHQMDLQLEHFIAPVVPVWEITGKCALQCLFCCGSFPLTHCDELSSDEKHALARELVEAQIWGINLSGGEPFLCPDLPWLVDYFTEHEIPVNVNTSGWGLTHALAERLKAKDDLVSIFFSIDAPVPALHDELRGRHGAFEHAVQSIEILRKMGKSMIGIECVVTARNIQVIDDMVELCRSWGVKQLRFQPVVLIGRGRNHADLALSETHLRLLVDKLRAIRERVAQEAKLDPARPRVQVHLADQTTHIIEGLRTGCNWGGIIGPDGALKISAYLYFAFGSIREAGGFMNLWRDGFKVGWKHPELRRTVPGLKSLRDIERIAAEMRYTTKHLDVRECLNIPVARGAPTQP